MNKSLQVLAECKFIKLESCASDLPRVPSIRACPTCGKLVEHTGAMCKNIFCPRCSVEFCFVCLAKTVDCLRDESNSYYNKCNRPMAPVQTKIPIWKRESENESDNDSESD